MKEPSSPQPIHVKMLSAIILRAKCRAQHQGLPAGTSCVDYVRIAKANPRKYAAEFRHELNAGEHLCSNCVVRVLARKALLGSDTGLTITDALLEADATSTPAANV